VIRLLRPLVQPQADGPPAGQDPWIYPPRRPSQHPPAL